MCGRTEIMWNTHRVGVTADNIVRYTVSSLTVLRHSLPLMLSMGLHKGSVWIIDGF